MGWHELTVESEALRGNPLGDPATRPLFVWTPPGYDEDPARRFPAIYLLHAMTGQARAWFNVSPFAPAFREQVDALGPEAMIVVVDGFTAVGGAQWIDSAGDRRLRPLPLRRRRRRSSTRASATLPSAGAPRARREVLGRFRRADWSLLRPDLFGGFATHAGDALFEVTLAAEFAPAAQALRNLYDGSFEAFWDDFRSGRPVLENRTDPLLQNVYAAPAAFSTRADGTVELPFRLDTGELVPGLSSSAGSRGIRSGSPRRTASAARRAARDLDRCRAATTSTGSISARSPSATRSAPPEYAGRGRSTSSSSTAATAASTAASRQPAVPREPGSPQAFRPGPDPNG